MLYWSFGRPDCDILWCRFNAFEDFWSDGVPSNAPGTWAKTNGVRSVSSIANFCSYQPSHFNIANSVALCVSLVFGVKPDCFDHVLVENMLFLFSLRLWHHGPCFSFLFCFCCCCCWYCHRQGSGDSCHLLLLPIFGNFSQVSKSSLLPFLSDWGNPWKSCCARQKKLWTNTFRIF